MKTIYGLLRDAGRDIIWFLIIALFAAFVFSALYSSFEGTGFSKEYEKDYYALKDQNYLFVRTTEIGEVGNKKQQPYELNDVLEDYFQTAMTKDGPAGMIISLAFMQQEEYLPNGLFLVGTAREFANVQLDDSGKIRAFASEALRKERPVLSFEGETVPVEVLPDDFKIYTFKSYFWDDEYLLFCPDFDAFLKTAGRGYYRILKYCLNDLILANPSDEDILALKQAALRGAGSFPLIERLEERISRRTLQAGMLRVNSTLWFNIAAAAGLIFSVLIIQKRLIQRRFHDYAVSHLFGVTFSALFLRIFLYCLLQYALAVAGAAWLLISIIGVVRPPSPLPWAALILGLSLGMTVLCFTKLKRDHMIYLRRSRE